MTKNSGRRGFFRTALEAMIESRQRQAERYVSNALLSLDDATLEAHGYSRAELQRRARQTSLV
jgi:hypothetical protein